MGASGGLSRREREVAGLVAEGLTNRQIAERLFISERTAESHVEQIRNKLGFRTRSQVAAWVAAGAANPPAAGTDDLGCSPLPLALSSIVGRTGEIQSTVALVGERPLVTITGPGGIGKTRLALEVARRVQNRFRGGVWLVELSAVRSGAQVPPAVAHALPLLQLADKTPEEQIARFLSTRDALLVLDNCEQVVDASAELVQYVLSRAPRLRILTTSREPLGVAGERVIRLEPLSVGAPGDKGSPAVELLVERCRDLGLGELVEDDLHHGAAICRHLGGIPLAIELAAAHAAVLSLGEIEARLDGQFMHLANPARPPLPRHHTLDAAVDWSYQLLGARERAAFRRFAVFPGGFDLDAAQALLEEDLGTTVEVVGSLLRKSMLTVRDPAPGHRRYHMLDPLREFASERLHGEGETERATDLHAQHYLDLAQAAYSHLRAAGGEVWLRRLDREWDNLNAALQLLNSRDDDRFGLMVAALGRYWIRGRMPNEGMWTDRVLQAGTLSGRPLFDVMEAWSWVNYQRGDLVRPLQIAEAMVEEAVRMNDDACIGRAMHWVAGFRWDLGMPNDLEYWQRAEMHLRRAGADWNLACVLNDRGIADLPATPDLARVLEALELARKVGDKWLVAMILDAAAWTHCFMNEPDAASSMWSEGVATALEITDSYVLPYHLEGVGHISRLENQFERACTLMAAGAGLRDAIGARPDSRQADFIRADLDVMREQLGPGFEACWQEGFRMSPAEAAELAIGNLRSA